MSIDKVFPEQYEQQLEEKLAQLKLNFSKFQLPDVQVFRSPKQNYRMRAELKIWHRDGQAHYAMYHPGEYKKPFVIEQFPVASELINQHMPKLLAAVNASALLRNNLFQVEFLTTLSGEALISMIYHKRLGDEWETEARSVQELLGADIIGRSRGQKLVLARDFVVERLQVGDQTFSYQQVETGFTQPNAQVCESMLSWAVSNNQNFGGDLLELYCGNGNFTLPLAQNFERVLATELAKSSLASARYNMELNKVDNVTLVRMSSEDFSQALDKVRSFNRLKDIDLDSYNFSTIFVDPPRAGLDDHTTEVTQRFENIIYISCNPETLRENLAQIIQTHKITAFAVFDQFPYTPHLECGVVLSKI